MADELPWFPFYVNKWMTNDDVLELDGDRMAAYLWLLCLQWQHEALPYEAHRVVPMVPRLISDVAVVDVFLRFFPPDPDTNLRRNPHLAAIREKQLETYRNKAKGLEVARKSRWENKLPESSTPTDDRTDDRTVNRRSSVYICISNLVKEGGVGGELVTGLTPYPEALTALDLLLAKLPSEAKRFTVLADVRSYGPGGSHEAGTWHDVAEGFREAVKSTDKTVPTSNHLRACVKNAKRTREAAVVAEAARRDARDSLKAESSVLGQPDANQRYSGWAEEELEA